MNCSASGNACTVMHSARGHGLVLPALQKGLLLPCYPLRLQGVICHTKLYYCREAGHHVDFLLSSFFWYRMAGWKWNRWPFAQRKLNRHTVTLTSQHKGQWDPLGGQPASQSALSSALGCPWERSQMGGPPQSRLEEDGFILLGPAENFKRLGKNRIWSAQAWCATYQFNPGSLHTECPDI